MQRRKAFTVIELLLVIGVLVLLAGIVVWGLMGAAGSNSAKVTKTTLQNLQSMSEELNRKDRLASLSAIYTVPPLPPPIPPPEVAPSIVTADMQDRNGAAVARTHLVITRLSAIPDNKRVLDKFPADQLMSYIPPGPGATQTGVVVLDGWRNPILFVPAAGLAGVTSKQPDSSGGGPFPRGARVVVGGKFFTARSPTPSMPPSAAWFEGILAPDGRHFWASAGADGHFGGGTNTADEKGSGDDNLYSFEH